MKIKLLLTVILFCVSLNMPAQQQQGAVTREQVLNLYYKAQKAEKNNRKDEAIEIYRTLLSIDPGLPTPCLKLANIYAADEDNISSLDSAIILYKKYLELSPDDKNAETLKNTVARLEEKLKSKNAAANSNLSQAAAKPPVQVQVSPANPSNPAVSQDSPPAAPASVSAEKPANLPAGVTEDTDINTLWEKAQVALKEKNYGIAGNLLNRIVSLVSPNHPLFAQSNILLANIYGDTGNTAKMQETINTLESYVEIHEQVVTEMDNTVQTAQLTQVNNKIPFEEDLCGVWVSDYSEDENSLPYVVLEVVNTGSKYYARILPHCTLAKKHGMYTGAPFHYSMANLSGEAAVKSKTATVGKTFLAMTENLEIHGDNNIATLYFGDESLKESKKGFAESAVHTVGVLMDNVVTDIVVAGLSLLFSELSASKTTVVTLDMHIKRLFAGCAELILEQNFYVERSTGKKSESQSSKMMKLYKLPSEYNVTFASEGLELFGYREFTKEEIIDREEYKKLMVTKDRKNFNKQAYKQLAEKVIERSKAAFAGKDNDLTREIRENFEYATQGFSYQEITNKNGTYKGWTDISGKSNGFGHARLNSGYEYLGEWKDSKYYGTGKYTIPGAGVYTGGFLNGKFHGKGIFEYLDGGKYEGEWKSGKKDGQGKYTVANGAVYEGTWKNDDAQNGKIKYADGDIYDGQCRYDKKKNCVEKHGKGIIIYANGEPVSGNWENDVLIIKN